MVYQMNAEKGKRVLNQQKKLIKYRACYSGFLSL